MSYQPEAHPTTLPGGGPSRLLSLPEVAELLALTVSRVRQLLREGQLLAIPGPDGSPGVPAELVSAAGVLRGLPGVITLLRDNGYSDAEAVRWLFTADPSLPGSPVQALQAGRGTEVRRRAQALGF